MRTRSTTCWVDMGGMPMRTPPVRSSSASENPRTMVAAAAAFFLCSSSVSALVHWACSFACCAFIWSSCAIVMLGTDFPLATDLTRLRSEEHTSELQSHVNLLCRLLLEKQK